MQLLCNNYIKHDRENRNSRFILCLLSLLSTVKTISEVVHFERTRTENNVTNILIRVSIGNVSRDR